MNEELTQKLREEFPVLFGPNEYSGFLRGFGFECSDGWYELVREFAIIVEAHNKTLPDKPVVALIVKEKYGSLRVQGLTNMNSFLWQHLRNVERKSTTICDLCGQPGQLMVSENGFLLATRCSKHAVSLGKAMELYNGDS